VTVLDGSNQVATYSDDKVMRLAFLSLWLALSTESL
jgi:hypothetical protein